MTGFKHAFAVICAFMLLAAVSSCARQEDGGDAREDSGETADTVFYDDMMTDNSAALEDVLTHSYDLSELTDFFEPDGVKANEAEGFHKGVPALTFDAVNQRFSAEIVRSGYYTVYKVSQGGYYYVFWGMKISSDGGESRSEPIVVFSAYLPASERAIPYEELTEGVSTAADVRELDPSFDLVFTMSRGLFSYSYLDEDTLLEVEYHIPDPMEEYGQLVVKAVREVPRDQSDFGLILPCDLPDDSSQ